MGDDKRIDFDVRNLRRGFKKISKMDDSVIEWSKVVGGGAAITGKKRIYFRAGNKLLSDGSV